MQTCLFFHEKIGYSLNYSILESYFPCFYPVFLRKKGESDTLSLLLGSFRFPPVDALGIRQEGKYFLSSSELAAFCCVLDSYGDRPSLPEVLYCLN